MKHSSDFANIDLKNILEIDQNNICNDCGQKEPRWCSINNAVFLCSTCAKTHKRFSSNISKVKSLEVDIWTDDDITILKLGGNLRFTNLMKSYNVPLVKGNQEYKYYTKAAQYYRQLLMKEFNHEDSSTLQQPTLKEGIEILFKDEYSSLFNKHALPLDEDYISLDNHSSNNNNNNGENNFFSNIAEKAKNIKITEKLKSAGEFVGEQTQKIRSSEVYRGIVHHFSNGINTLFNRTERFFGITPVSNVQFISIDSLFGNNNNINNNNINNNN